MNSAGLARWKASAKDSTTIASFDGSEERAEYAALVRIEDRGRISVGRGQVNRDDFEFPIVNRRSERPLHLDELRGPLAQRHPRGLQVDVVRRVADHAFLRGDFVAR